MKLYFSSPCNKKKHEYSSQNTGYLLRPVFQQNFDNDLHTSIATKVQYFSHIMCLVIQVKVVSDQEPNKKFCVKHGNISNILFAMEKYGA